MSKYIFYKDSSLNRPRNISKSSFASASYGQQYIYEPKDNKFNVYFFSSSADLNSQDHLKIGSLKNLINGLSAVDDIYNFENFYNSTSSMLTLNSYYLGSGISRGSVKLTTYFSGSVLDTLTDARENGVLSSSIYGKCGVVFYKEGIFLLNNPTPLTSAQVNINYSVDNPRWTNYYASSSTDAMFYDIEYSYIESVPTMIFMAEAKKNELNHSNNYTYISSGSYSFTASSNSFKENEKILIKNTVKSPFISGSAQFEKETYITKIGLYDKDKKLVGVGSLANPVRKTENREFVFKLKIDI